MDRKWWTLIVVCTSMFMLLMDITIVNVALSDISSDLGSSFTELQWVIDAYALTLAALLLTAGSLADLLGRRRLFVAGLALFTLASLACGLATTPLFLILARAVQGAGGAVMFATNLALIGSAFTGRDRGTAFGAFGATAGLAVSVGPLVGGALTTAFGWEWIFFVNIPIGLAAIAITRLRVEESRNPDARGVDWPGLVTWSAALFLLVFGLLRANTEGWGSAEIVGSFVASALLLVAFIVIERRRDEAMLDLDLFRKPTFCGAGIAAFAVSASILATFLYIALYVQRDLGYSAWETGLRFLPVSICSFLAAGPSGRLTSVVPVRFLLGGGLALIGIGLLLMRNVEPGSDWTVLVPGMILAGLGIGLTNPPVASTAIAVVPPARAGMASGINNTFRQVGIATGIAALGTLFSTRVETKLADSLAGTPLGARASHLSEQISAGGEDVLGKLPRGQRETVLNAIDSAFVSGLDEIFLIAGILALVASVAALVLVKQRELLNLREEKAPVPAGSAGAA
jgi:EmrB/QacA subfamily drug resistance transporter